MTEDVNLAPNDAAKPPKGVARSLNKARNDTGRVAYCGPYVVSAITGEPISLIEEAFREGREGRSRPKSLVKGTSADEVQAVLARFGYRMDAVASFLDRPKKERPTVWSWMQKPRKASTYYILAISRGRQGHWILIKGVVICDTYTDGAWTFVCDGPHRGSRIMEIYAVTKSSDLQKLALSS